jgi:phage shock protein A
MAANLEQQKAAVEKLIANTRFLETKMAEAKSKKDTLKVRPVDCLLYVPGSLVFR